MHLACSSPAPYRFSHELRAFLDSVSNFLGAIGAAGLRLRPWALAAPNKSAQSTVANQTETEWRYKKGEVREKLKAPEMK